MVYTMEEIKEKIQLIAEKHEIPAIYLFGSYARNEADEDSDIDLAIELGNSDFTGFELLDIEDEFKSKFSIPVDFLIVEDIERGKSPIALLVKENFNREKVKIYEAGTVKERLLFY